MEEIKIIQLKQSVFEDNNKDADRLRASLKASKTFLMNLMSSPGSGKTTTLLALSEILTKQWRIAVMEADIDSKVDAETLTNAGVTSIQLHTGGMCHLDADMTRQGLLELEYENYDLVILENVGNLVCPAEFDTGAHKNIMLFSLPEGDDKPLKYPLMYSVSDVVIITKIDTKDFFDFDMELAESHIRELNPNALIFKVSAKTGEGMEEVADYFKKQVKEAKRG